MLVVFSPIFVVDTKIISVYSSKAPLSKFHADFKLHNNMLAKTYEKIHKAQKHEPCKTGNIS